MDSKKRMYYYDQKYILMDDVDESKRFDQNYDEFYNSRDSKSNFYQSNISQNNMKNLMSSGENYNSQNIPIQNSHDQTLPNQVQNSHVDLDNQQNQTSNLLSEALISALKDQYQKTKGYMEHNPEVLLAYVQEYKSFVKKGLKIPYRIYPFLGFSDSDIYFSLKYYFDELMKTKEKMRLTNSSRLIVNKFRTKFSKETLKRLYPFLKDEEAEKQEKNLYHLDKFVERLVYHFFNVRKEFTLANDENALFEFWQTISEEEKEKMALKWSKGENNLYAELMGFFSEDATIMRLCMIFKSICGYWCIHPRPLHDHWVKIPIQEKYLKGLAKFDTDTLYKLMHDKYVKKSTEQKEKELKDKELEKTRELEKTKPDHEKFQRLKKKLKSLAKPKDRWRAGRAMIHLRKTFKYDNILRKMIKIEFQENRRFKYPHEYAVYDSDEERRIIFKNSLEKGIKKENEEEIRNMIEQTKFKDDKQKRDDERDLREILEEDAKLDKYLKKMCIAYWRIRKAEFEGTKETKELPDHFLTKMYHHMVKAHKHSTKRRFPRVVYGGLKKKSRFSNYPKELKYYFKRLMNRMQINKKGEFVFARNDNMSFWAPSLSNQCKIHRNNCPLYCSNNTQNRDILDQRKKNFNHVFNPGTKLEEGERLNVWKRKDSTIKDTKSRIFLLNSEVEHCTFEPKINKKEDDMRLLSSEDIINKRISNKQWVDNMGGNFSKFPILFKEGIVKRANIHFQSGNFTECLRLLETAFELDPIRAKFDAKFKVIYEKRLEEESKKGKKKDDDPFERFGGMDKKKHIEKDIFSNPKNNEVCYQVFCMLKDIDEYKGGLKKEAKKIKEEIKLIKDGKKDKSILENHSKQLLEQSTLIMKSHDSFNKLQTIQKTMHTINFVKDKYFKFFKTLMCPLK
jgi:hypothetical protein